MNAEKILQEKWQFMGSEQSLASDLLSEEEEYKAGNDYIAETSDDLSTPTPKLQIPKIYCSTKDKKFNLFDKFSYAQLIEFLVRSRIAQGHRTDKSSGRVPKQGKRDRGVFHEWLKAHVDLRNKQCSDFITENENSLLRLKNKRQLLMFLNRRFEKTHHLRNDASKFTDCVSIVKSLGKSNASKNTNPVVLPVLLSSMLLTLVFVLMLFTLFFKTNTFERLFYSYPPYMHLIKTSKTFLSAMAREL